MSAKKQEQPVTEQPVTEQPVTEQPVAEQVDNDPVFTTQQQLDQELAEVQRLKAQLLEERQRMLEADMGFVDNPDVKGLLDSVEEAKDTPKAVDPLDQESVHAYIDRMVKEQVAAVVKSIQERQEQEQAKLQYQQLQAKYPQLKDTAFKKQLNALLDNYEKRGLGLDFEDAITLTIAKTQEASRAERAESAAQSGTGRADRKLPLPQLETIDDVKEVLKKRGLL